MTLLIEEVRLPEARITPIEQQFSEAAKHSAACQTLLSVPGVGLLTATTILAATELPAAANRWIRCVIKNRSRRRD